MPAMPALLFWILGCSSPAGSRGWGRTGSCVTPSWRAALLSPKAKPIRRYCSHPGDCSLKTVVATTSTMRLRRASSDLRVSTVIISKRAIRYARSGSSTAKAERRLGPPAPARPRCFYCCRGSSRSPWSPRAATAGVAHPATAGPGLKRMVRSASLKSFSTSSSDLYRQLTGEQQ